MKGKRHCGSIKDIKMSCPTCKKNFFFPVGNYTQEMLKAFKEHGPVRISCPWECYYQGSTYSVEIDLDNPKDWYGESCATPEKRDLYDVAYFGEDYAEGKKFQDLIKNKFPMAKIGDASDCIHGKRTSVYLSGKLRGDYLCWLVEEGYAICSLTVNLALMDKAPSEDKDTLKAAIKALEKNEPVSDRS